METKTKKSKQKESSIGRSLHGALASEFSEAQIKTEIIGEGESISSKGIKKKEKAKERKVKKEKKEKKTRSEFSPDQAPFPTQQPFMPQQHPMGMPSPWGTPIMPHGSSYGFPQSPMSSMFPPMPGAPTSLQSPLMQSMPPPPPMLEGMDSMDPSLHALLLSWYMAGYQAGRYQTSQAKTSTKVKDKSKSPV